MTINLTLAAKPYDPSHPSAWTRNELGDIPAGAEVIAEAYGVGFYYDVGFGGGTELLWSFDAGQNYILLARGAFLTFQTAKFTEVRAKNPNPVTVQRVSFVASNNPGFRVYQEVRA